MDEGLDLDHARVLLRMAQSAYLDARREGATADEAMAEAMGGRGCPTDMLGLTWASGALDEAWEAAQDPMGQAVISCGPVPWADDFERATSGDGQR
ncbi:MAG: hypothetical protein MR415_10195 [Coriobacteriaceae bacterium]|nr:hypothetical protein [Coriobacteriaceae bacterium]MDD7585309.1 hypothetical protein [Coriobacteriaceae bacterium]